jgi:hypothetical protein
MEEDNPQDNIVDLRLGFYLEDHFTASFHFFIPSSHQERVDLAREFAQRIFHIRFDRQALRVAEEEENISDSESEFSLPEAQVVSEEEEEFSEPVDPLDLLPTQVQGPDQVWYYNPHLDIWTREQFSEVRDFATYLQVTYSTLNSPEPICKPTVHADRTKLIYSPELQAFYYENCLPRGTLLAAKFNKQRFDWFHPRQPPQKRVKAVW